MLLGMEAAKRIKSPTDPAVKIIVNHSDYFRLGSIGPDLLFFAPDYDPAVQDLLKRVLQVYDDVVAPLKALYEKAIEPVREQIDRFDEAVFATLDAATCNSFSSIQQEIDATLALFQRLRDTAILALFTDAVNVFDTMRPPIQQGHDETRWFWFDMLHYRRTGTFVKEMWARADTPEKKAYVLGYCTHLAADATGHAYVNEVVGGPYRSHNQRHHFVENILDVYLYDVLRGEELTNSKLHLKLPYGTNLDGGPLLAVLQGTANTPAPLQAVLQMISESMPAAYAGSTIPTRLRRSYLKTQELEFTYWLMAAVLKMSTTSYVPRPKPPGAQELESILNSVDTFLLTLATPPAFPSVGLSPDTSLFNPDGDFSMARLQQWANAVWDAICYLAQLLEWCAKLLKDLYDVFACTFTAPPKISIRAGLWILQAGLYTMFEQLRGILVLAAIAPPTREWVAHHPIARRIVAVSGPNGYVDSINHRYPHRAQKSNDGYLKYPGTNVEKEPTYVGPHDAGSSALEMLAPQGLDRTLEQRYVTAPTPTNTRSVEARTIGQAFASAMTLGTELMAAIQSSGAIPDWNLDADRGYGYRCWKATYANLAWNSAANVDDTYL
jgi:hypothetical protein